jgi:glycosyltransferase involved in cell wall biosynthesis
MRIAIFSDNFYPEMSGITDSILTLGKELASRGHRILYCGPHYSKANYRLLNRAPDNFGPNIETIRLPSFPFPTGTRQSRMALPIGTSLTRLKKFNPDIIHFHHIYGVGLESMLAAKFLKKPFIGTNHTTLAEFLRYSPLKVKWITDAMLSYESWFHNHARFVSSPTHFIIDGMKGFDTRIPHRTISNPIMIDAFRPADSKIEFKKKFGLAPFTVLYAGRLADEKRIGDIILAVAQAKRTIPDVMLAIVGQGAADGALIALAKKLNMESNVKFFGFVPDEVLPEIYNASDVFTIMSTAETQCISAMQALACKIPVIAAAACGLKEYITPEVGFLVEPENSGALAEKILLLHKDTGLRKKMGEAGYIYVRKFSPESIATQWEEVYKKYSAHI